MASGHVNRTERPNTWQHRPSLRRDDSSCQPGAVHTWHQSAMPMGAENVRSWGQTGSGRHAARVTRLTRNGRVRHFKGSSQYWRDGR